MPGSYPVKLDLNALASLFTGLLASLVSSDRSASYGRCFASDFFKRYSFCIEYSSGTFDFIGFDYPELRESLCHFTLKTQNEVFSGAKRLRWLRPFAGTQAVP